MNKLLQNPKYLSTALKIGFTVVFAALLLPGRLHAQAPAISYAGPKTFNLNVAGTLTPTSSNVAAPTGVYGSPVVLGSGISFSQNGLALDAAGNMYVADMNGSSGIVDKISADGSSTTVIGSGFLSQSSNVAVDQSGNVFVADQSQVWKIPASGSPVTYGTPVVINSNFSRPFAIAVDKAGNVYVSDLTNGVYKMANNGTNVVRIDNGLTAVAGLTVDAADNVYAATISTLALYEIPANGGAGAQVQLASGLSFPRGLAVDANGTIYIDDEGMGGIYSVPAGGGTPVAAVPGLSNLVGVAVDPSYNLYGALQGSGGINKFSPTGGFFISPALPAGLSLNATTGIISGTATAVSPAANYTVSAFNASGGGVATVNIRVASSNDNLSALKLSAGVLSPVFSIVNTTYTANVVNSARTISLTPRAEDSTAVITINGQPVTSGHASAPFALSLGDNAFGVVVTSSNGTKQKTYTLTVTRATSTNANLSALQVSRGLLTTSFAPLINSYTATVANGVSSIMVTPVTFDADATVTVNGAAAVSGTACGPVALAVGSNIITTVVTASDGVTQNTYTVTITRTGSKNDFLKSLKISRGVLSQVFTGSNTNYTANVVNGVSSLTVTPIASDITATLLLNGTTPIVSGATSAQIPLAVGANPITVQVTAQDGSTMQTYTVTVTRAAATNDFLTSLKLSRGVFNPVFTSANTNYTVDVVNGAGSLTVTPTAADANATLLLNGTTPIASGTTSAPIALAVGANPITVQVTAQDGSTTQTYRVTVNRALGSLNIPDESLSVVQPLEKAKMEDNVSVRQGLSPNGDGINDYLVIDGIQTYPDNKLTIMNRNGALVFEAKGYDNSSRVFDGRSNKNGQLQLPGTYFYSLEYAVKGEIKHKTGFIVLKY